MTKKCDLIGVGIMSGHAVSHSNRKINREFIPNLQELALNSDALGVKVKLKIATSTLRTVNKYGNLDSFLVNYRFNRMTDTAKKLRKKVIDALEKKGELSKVKFVKEKKEKKAS